MLLLLLQLCSALAANTNILFLLADDQGFGDIGYTASQGASPGAGGGRWSPNPPRTPNLDALANAPGTLILDRMYSGSPVCSPTRASLLTGRTPDRECVFNAEGCGQEPAWSCINPEPFPGGYAAGESNIFTAANAAKEAGYATLHTGKCSFPARARKARCPQNQPT
jgi:arylsulfatase A-like enzyme